MPTKSYSATVADDILPHVTECAPMTMQIGSALTALMLIHTAAMTVVHTTPAPVVVRLTVTTPVSAKVVIMITTGDAITVDASSTMRHLIGTMTTDTVNHVVRMSTRIFMITVTNLILILGSAMVSTKPTRVS
jgi:hypothetical protein